MLYYRLPRRIYVPEVGHGTSVVVATMEVLGRGISSRWAHRVAKQSSKTPEVHASWIVWLQTTKYVYVFCQTALVWCLPDYLSVFTPMLSGCVSLYRPRNLVWLHLTTVRRTFTSELSTLLAIRFAAEVAIWVVVWCGDCCGHGCPVSGSRVFRGGFGVFLAMTFL